MTRADELVVVVKSEQSKETIQARVKAWLMVRECQSEETSHARVRSGYGLRGPVRKDGSRPGGRAGWWSKEQSKETIHGGVRKESR